MRRESQDNSRDQNTAGSDLPPVDHTGNPLQPDGGCSCSARSVSCPFCQHANTSLEQSEYGIHRYACGTCGKFFAYAAGEVPRGDFVRRVVLSLKFRGRRKRDGSSK
jgi:hypothetical protein